MAHVVKSISAEEWYSPSKRLKITRHQDGSIYINDRNIRLTNSEAKIFICIVSGEGKVRTHTMMLAALYGDKTQAHQKILDVHISRIRRKLMNHTPSAAKALVPVWGRGYAFGKIKPTQPGVSIITPPEHWVPARKIQVLEAINSGRASVEATLHSYPDLSREELDEWGAFYEVFGKKGLRSSFVQKHRI